MPAKFRLPPTLLSLFLFFSAATLTTCTKDNATAPPKSDPAIPATNNKAPRTFSVQVVLSGPNELYLRWTESRDPENSFVIYDIYVAPNHVDSALKKVASGLKESEYSDTKHDKNESVYVDGVHFSYQQFPKPSPEYHFMYPLLGLRHKTPFKGKIVARDEDGMETEQYFYSTTLEDITPPRVTSLNSKTYRDSARVGVGSDPYEKSLEIEYYLNNQFIGSKMLDSCPKMSFFLGTLHYVVYKNLTPATVYQIKIILHDRLDQQTGPPLITTFTTTN